MYNITPNVKPEHFKHSKPKTQPDTRIEHHTNHQHTPQPSTPIKHAGSNCWRIELKGRWTQYYKQKMDEEYLDERIVKDE